MYLKDTKIGKILPVLGFLDHCCTKKEDDEEVNKEIIDLIYTQDRELDRVLVNTSYKKENLKHILLEPPHVTSL